MARQSFTSFAKAVREELHIGTKKMWYETKTALRLLKAIFMRSEPWHRG